jgi:hypothetical protein
VALFHLFEQTKATLDGRPDIGGQKIVIGGGGGGGGGGGYEAAKAAATSYAARREALLRGAAPQGSPLAQWRV